MIKNQAGVTVIPATADLADGAEKTAMRIKCGKTRWCFLFLAGLLSSCSAIRTASMAPAWPEASRYPQPGFGAYSGPQTASAFGGFDYHQTLAHPVLRYQVLVMAAAMANISLYAATGYVRNTRTSQFIYIDRPLLDRATASQLASELAATGQDLAASQEAAFREAGTELLKISALLAGNDRSEALRQVFFFRNLYPGEYLGPQALLYGTNRRIRNFLGNRLWSFIRLATGNMDASAYLTVLRIMQLNPSWPD